MLSASKSKESSFTCEVLVKGKEFELNLEIQDDLLIITISEKCPNKVIKKTYRDSYRYDSLQKVHKFFSVYENIFEVFSAIKDVISRGSYELEEGEKNIFLKINFPGKEVKLNIPKQTLINGETIMIMANGLFELKNNFIKKLTELDKINQSFFKIKKKNKELIKENKELNENNEKINKENKELNEIIKNLKETRIEILNTKVETLLTNTSKANEDIKNLKEALTQIVNENLKSDSKKDQEKPKDEICKDFEGKLTGDLLKENTIAFDNLCKAYLWNWLSDGDNNKKIKTVLLYKGTRDGDKALTFHTKCNNKGATLTLVKSTTNFHFGGFTKAEWSSSREYKSDKSSFLFSLDKKLKFSVKSFDKAIRDYFHYGPTFGSGYDLNIADECMNNEKSYSETLTYDIIDTNSFSGRRNFKVSEIEVYKIIFE